RPLLHGIRVKTSLFYRDRALEQQILSKVDLAHRTDTERSHDPEFVEFVRWGPRGANERPDS
ncbi:MAG: hypothetical protein ABIY55_05855, partial [Kofleriaceae bacterium]